MIIAGSLILITMFGVGVFVISTAVGLKAAALIVGASIGITLIVVGGAGLVAVGINRRIAR